MSFKPIDNRPNFSQMEEDVLLFWEKENIFKKTLEKNKNGKPFVFFEGPPTANAKPGIHHVEARAFKDLIPRYQTMRGRFVNRKAGWDTHGLPVELQIEKKLGISGKKQIESIKSTVRESIIEFNRLCKESVWQFKEDWEKLTNRMGFWVDLQDPYVTYHNSYIESLWHVVKKVWDKGLIYQGHKVVPYCPRCGTALSSHEVAQGYKDVTDNSVYIKFKVKSGKFKDAYILSWTTTPWTLPGNIALAVGEDIDYVLAQEVGSSGIIQSNEHPSPSGEIYILAKDILEKNDQKLNPTDQESKLYYFFDKGYRVLDSFKGRDLVGLEYEPLFEVPSLKSDKSYKVYAADFVTTTDGTGVVHTAVMYGEDDYQLGEKIGLPKVHTVDETGHFVNEVQDLAGMYAKDEQTENKIFEHLKNQNLLLKVDPYTHEYPHCWRCNTALLYYARDSWFIKMSALREKLLKNNEQINWVPDYIKHGRFGEWLKDVKDWAISRERYWGTPLPIWQCQDCKDYQVVGSIKDLKLSTNTFIFSRHGEAENNVKGIIISWPEPEIYHLTKNGIKLANKLAKSLKEQGGLDLVFASDITRTRETAEIVGKELGVEVNFDPRLREYNLGVYNGHKIEEFEKDWPFERRWNEAPQGGETHKQLLARALDFIQEADKKYENKRILIITHGDVLWNLQKYFSSERPYPTYAQPFVLDVGIADLHRPYIDDVILKCEKCGKDARRVLPVMDVWFDSGAMPIAQWHYPFENQEKFEGKQAQFPADFISEAIDQTRGWFYTLLAVSTLLDLGPAYKNVINLGHLMDDKGQKMSKSKGNIIDPWAVINKQGVDALRWYMYTVNQPGDSKLFSVNDLDLIIRKNFLILWNVLSFLVTYAGFDKWSSESKPSENSLLDKWQLAKTQQLVNEVTLSLDNYDVFRASRTIEPFINELSTWYVRRSRDHKGPAFYQTVYQVLKTLAVLMAPFTPFLSESIWQVLKQNQDPESVHLADWPETKKLSKTEQQLLADMEVVQKIVELGHALRKEASFKVRQPLNSVQYFLKNHNSELDKSLEDIIRDELNVKNVNKMTRTPVDFQSKENDAVRVALDIALSDELKKEGLARELERAVQEIRKKTGLKVGENVKLSYYTESKDIESAFELFDRKKTFVTNISTEKTANGEEITLDGNKVMLTLNKA